VASPSQSKAAADFTNDTHNPESFRGIRGIREIRGKILVRKTLEISHLQITPPKQVRFCPKNGPGWQKNSGPTEIILHFFLCFHGLFLFSASQPFDWQPPAPAHPRQKNRAKKPTIGFLPLRQCATIAAMKTYMLRSA
jgi:hypothetical protein